MFDFMCLQCGQDFTADPQGYSYEQDGDTIDGHYTVVCPHCGRVLRCCERFKWDGITDIT